MSHCTPTTSHTNAQAGPSNSIGPPVGGAGNNLTRAQFETVRKLVRQVARAFFDPPWVIVLDRLVSQDAWGSPELTRSLGFTSQVEAKQFLEALRKQRLIRFHVSHERNPTWDPSLRRGKKTVEKPYWYIDYREFVLTTRFRMGSVRARLEGERKAPIENIATFACPLCHKTFHELDIPSLMQPLPSGDFLIVCDVCSSEVQPREEGQEGYKGREKVDSVNDRLTRWNERTGHLTESLKEVQGMVLEPFDIEQWLLDNVPATIKMEIDERTGRKKLPKEVREESAAVVATTEEEELERAKEALAKAERQRLSDVLPVWHTQSTVSGAHTALGLTHQQQTDRRIADAKAAVKQAQVDLDQEADDELEAYYAALEPEGEGEDEDMEEVDVEQEPTSAGPSDGSRGDSMPPSRSGSVSSGGATPRSERGDDGEDRDGEVKVDPVQANLDSNGNGHGQKPGETMVYADGKLYGLSEVDDDLIQSMSEEEYRIYDELQAAK